jgi:hypothetical protein
VATADEAELLVGDQEQRDALLHRLMNERVEAWMVLATERLSQSDVPLFHESGGERTIGATICINPGSEANHCILRGYLVDVGDAGIERVLRVKG